MGIQRNDLACLHTPNIDSERGRSVQQELSHTAQLQSFPFRMPFSLGYKVNWCVVCKVKAENSVQGSYISTSKIRLEFL